MRLPRTTWPFFALAWTACGSAQSGSFSNVQPLAQLRQAASANTLVTLRPLASASLCVTVQGGKNEDGAAVVLAVCDGRAGQAWQRIGNHIVAFSDKCLNVSNGLNQDGTRLQIYTCAQNDNNSAWKPTVQQLTWQLAPDQCLDVTDGNFVTGTPLQIWTCSQVGANDHQSFGWTYETGALAATPAAAAPAPAAKPAAPSAAARLRMGVHIDYDNGATNGVAGFVARTGVTPAMTAGYVRAEADGSFEYDTSKVYIDQAAANHVPAISLAVTSNQGGQLTAQQLVEIQSTVAYGVQMGLSVEVRFGYEMNGNWSPSYHGNDPTTFRSQWAQLAPLVHKAGGKMVWSPNNDGGSIADYERWLPDDVALVDAFALDFYHNDIEPIGGNEVANAIGLLYPLCEKYNKPFYFGETAVTVHDGDFSTAPSQKGLEMKLAWLDQLVSQDVVDQFPLYKGFTWFDYDKTESSTGLAGGTVTHNRFTLSQDLADARQFKAWKSAHQGVE